MENCFGMFGWEEFYRNRKNILCEYDKTFELTKNRPVRTAHGEAVEAYIRKWLAEFIPKKWAVTSGYIIPTLYNYDGKLYHYDIIIYDQINAPILWTEGNSDDSEQGKFRAIPAKYVAGVIEVKSRLTSKSINDMQRKLSEINFFSDQLPATFFSSGIFIELKEENNKKKTLEGLLSLYEVDRFGMGMILRWDQDSSITGEIIFIKRDINEEGKQDDSNSEKIADYLPEIYIQEDGNISVPPGATVMMHASKDEWLPTKAYSAWCCEGDKSIFVTWSHNGFTSYCMRLLSFLEGIPPDQNNSNKPCYGHIFDKLPRQPATPEEGMPFIELSFDVLDNGKKIKVSEDDGEYCINFSVLILNNGDEEAKFSDCGFKKIGTIPAGKSFLRSFNATIKKDLVKDGNLFPPIPYRIVFYPAKGERRFWYLERTFDVLSFDEIVMN